MQIGKLKTAVFTNAAPGQTVSDNKTQASQVRD